MTKKGISLPTNMLVILAVAVLVLFAIVAFFSSGFETGPVDDRVVINACCSLVVSNEHCNEGSWDPSLVGLSQCDDQVGEVCVEVGGHESICSDYVPSPNQCPPC